jgi:aminoglycoside phosphotransferase (APT) family kinase protein
MHRQGFPAPRPLLLIEDDEPFGGPFVLMERLAGRPLLEELQARPWRLWHLAAQMGALHGRLHQLTPDGFPDADGDLLDKSLQAIRARVSAYGLEGLRPGVDWLLANRPRRTRMPRPLHLDWHPLNLICCNGRMAALDWSEAEVGDRHADVATTLLVLRCLPPPPPAPWQRPFIPLVRGVLARHYLRTYRRRLPLDQGRLSYYSAWAALRRLSNYGRWFSVGPGCNGSKPSALRQINATQCEDVCNYFTQHSGVQVKLEYDGW